MEFLGKLGIDLKLLIAQIVNFLVLLWLLQKFLYKPLIRNLEKRVEKAKEIEEKEKEIQEKKEELRKREKEMLQKTKEKTRQILEETKEISKEEKERILKRAEEEVREILREAREKAEIEVKKIREREKEEILEKAKEFTRKALSLSFNRELHRKYLKEVIEELKGLNFEKIRGKEIVSVVVVSAFPLEKAEEKEIADLLFSKLKNSSFQEKVEPELIAGIKVFLNGFVIDGTLENKIKSIIV
jgi:F-type H+-transporting ATPase subunit b